MINPTFSSELSDKEVDQIKSKFHFLVEILKEKKVCNSVMISRLARLVWRLAEKEVYPFHYMKQDTRFVGGANFTGSGVDKIHFFHQLNGAKIGNLSFSLDWNNQCKKDWHLGMCGIIWCGSQMRDHWNRKISTFNDTIESYHRADAYVAEFLHSLKAKDYKFQENQKYVMNLYPRGLGNIKHLLYNPTRPCVDAK